VRSLKRCLFEMLRNPEVAFCYRPPVIDTSLWAARLSRLSSTGVSHVANRMLRKSTNHKDRYTPYKASAGDCGTCSLKSRCTQAPRRGLARHLYEEALNRMQKRVTPEAMRQRRSTVEHPFATIKYRIFGHPRLLMRGLSGAKVEIGLATMAYNLKRITNVLGTVKLTEALHRA